MKSKLSVLAVLLTASLLMSGCISQTNNNSANNTNTAAQAIADAKEKVQVVFSVKGLTEMVGKTIEAEKGANAFEEMKKAFDVNYTVSSFGPFITGINGEQSQSDSYWAMYIDGNYAMVGINALVLDKNMEIAWRLEKIQQP